MASQQVLKLNIKHFGSSFMAVEMFHFFVLRKWTYNLTFVTSVICFNGNSVTKWSRRANLRIFFFRFSDVVSNHLGTGIRVLWSGFHLELQSPEETELLVTAQSKLKLREMMKTSTFCENFKKRPKFTLIVYILCRLKPHLHFLSISKDHQLNST